MATAFYSDVIWMSHFHWQGHAPNIEEDKPVVPLMPLFTTTTATTDNFESSSSVIQNIVVIIIITMLVLLVLVITKAHSATVAAPWKITRNFKFDFRGLVVIIVDFDTDTGSNIEAGAGVVRVAIAIAVSASASFITTNTGWQNSASPTLSYYFWSYLTWIATGVLLPMCAGLISSCYFKIRRPCRKLLAVIYYACHC